MNKPYYGVYVTEDERGLFADIEKFYENENLAYLIERKTNRYQKLLHFNICPSKKRAQEIKDAWNESYRNNGTYRYRQIEGEA